MRRNAARVRKIKVHHDRENDLIRTGQFADFGGITVVYDARIGELLLLHHFFEQGAFDDIIVAGVDDSRTNDSANSHFYLFVDIAALEVGSNTAIRNLLSSAIAGMEIIAANKII